MCLRCDGYTEEQVQRQQDLAIRVHGYMPLHVQGSNDPADAADGIGNWTYTLGLNENFAHPDLICLQIRPEAQTALVQAVSDAIVEDGYLDPAILIDLDIKLVKVHEDHLADGLVDQWCERVDRLPMRGEFLQIIPGPSWFCECHPESVQRMDDPTRLVGVGYHL